MFSYAQPFFFLAALRLSFGDEKKRGKKGIKDKINKDPNDGDGCWEKSFSSLDSKSSYTKAIQSSNKAANKKCCDFDLLGAVICKETVKLSERSFKQIQTQKSSE